MALIVEDGSGVDGAESYVSFEKARAFAAMHGLSFPTDETEGERALRQAVEFLETYRDRYRGQKTSASNALQWPRRNATLDGFAIASNVIPKEIVQAQIHLASEAANGPLMVTGEGRETIEERVEGAVTVRYAATGNANPQPVHTRALALIRPLLRNGVSLRSVRV